MVIKFPNKYFIIKEINKRINTFEKKSIFRSGRVSSISIIVAILASISATLLSLKITGKWQDPIRITTIIISGLISVLTFFIGFVKDKQLWIVYNNTANSLKALKLKINSKTIIIDLTDNQLDEYLIDYQKILDNANKTWTDNTKS
jgi:hypothetical protein